MNNIAVYYHITLQRCSIYVLYASSDPQCVHNNSNESMDGFGNECII